MMHNILFFNNLFAAVAENCQKHGFLGLRPWYYYLPDQDFDPKTCDIQHLTLLGKNSDFILILLAIVDDLLRLAGLIAVGFVIYGAIRMIGSQGDPEGLSKAQDTIINALIGLVIAIVAAAFVGFLGNKLGG